MGFIDRQRRQPLDNSPGDESPSAGVRKPGQWSEGFLWFFTLSLPVVAPQTWTCTETDAKRPEETKRFVFCRRVPQPVLINNHYRLPSPQSVDDMNVGPKGRSGGVPPHPEAPMSHFGRMGSCPSWGPGWEAFVGVSPQARGYDVSSGECDSCPFTGEKVLEALGFSGCRDVE